VKGLLAGKGGFFIMAIAVRIRSALTSLYIMAEKSGFQIIPVAYQFENNNLSANFSFRTLLLWKVPP
jgi:hypothetical protein